VIEVVSVHWTRSCNLIRVGYGVELRPSDKGTSTDIESPFAAIFFQNVHFTKNCNRPVSSLLLSLMRGSQGQILQACRDFVFLDRGGSN